jgi:DNA-binding beta-propeller fold protein YncE
VNILYVSQWFSSSGGGGEVLFMQIVSGMAKNGHNVHIIKLWSYSISVIDGLSDKVISKISLSVTPVSLGVNSLINRVYVIDYIRNNILLKTANNDRIHLCQYVFNARVIHILDTISSFS